jgi:transcriptional regulator with XRE-family HTH domain
MNKNVDDKMQLRRSNLLRLKEQTRDEWQTLAKRLGTTKSWLSQLSTGHRPFSEKTARGFEKKLGLSSGWFDTDHGQIAHSRPTSQSGDQVSLASVITAIDAAVKAIGQTAFRDDAKYGRLLELIYEDSKERGMPQEAWLTRLLKLILD